MLFYGLCQWKKRETIVLKGEQKVDDDKIKDVIDNNCELQITGSSYSRAGNDHVGSRGVDCHWMPYVRAWRQYVLVGDADNAHAAARGVDRVAQD